jgi:hypothetical protein
MTETAAENRRLDAIIWAITAAIAGAVLVSTLAAGFTIVWQSFAAPGLAAAIFMAAQRFYETRRPDPRLAAALGCTAQLLAFAAVGAPLSYIAASANLPLQDHWFDAADRAAGLDWSALLAWMNAHPGLHPFFREVYRSLMPQTVVVVLALALAGRFTWLRVFMLTFILATLATIALSALVPAQGIWGFHGLQSSDYPNITPDTRSLHLAVFHGLRDGSFRLLMAAGSEGIITFPSLHAALAVILAAGFWPLRWLRWPGLILNGAMLISIPVDGGHYFSDIAAGLAMAGIALWSAMSIADRARCTAQAAMAIVGK